MQMNNLLLNMKFEIASLTIQLENNELNFEIIQECTDNKADFTSFKV